MMADPCATNRAMFWRIIRRLFGANRGRLFVMLLALGAGAAVTAALLNLQVDAKRRLTSEFRAFGPNIIVVPKRLNSLTSPGTLDRSIIERIPKLFEAKSADVVPFLYGLAFAIPQDGEHSTATTVVIAGTKLQDLRQIEASWKFERAGFHVFPGISETECMLGARLAAELHAEAGASVELQNGTNSAHVHCSMSFVISSGGSDDNQAFVPLSGAENLTGAPGRLSLVQISFRGTPDSVNRYIAALETALPEADIRPIRQFTEGEAKIYNRISGLLTATVAIVLLLTGLCVMAAMTNVAMERKMDVGLMKAIGASMRRVLRLFLTEAALLGLAGGMIGAAAGIFLSIGLGKAVFGVAARPRLIVYPVAVALTVIVAILSAFPLRRLASIRPASVFRGEA
jgi:putative ABC transport system permease protein